MPVPCRSCRTQIEWGVTTKTGRPIPLDLTTSPEGNIAVVGVAPKGQPLVMVLTPEELARAKQYGTPALYTTHFVTCPDATKWRHDQQRKRGATQ